MPRMARLSQLLVVAHASTVACSAATHSCSLGADSCDSGRGVLLIQVKRARGQDVGKAQADFVDDATSGVPRPATGSAAPPLAGASASGGHLGNGTERAGDATEICATQEDARAYSYFLKVAAPGTPCVFGADARDEGAHCILDGGQYGSDGWCFTSSDRWSWGSCNAHCKPAGAQETTIDVPLEGEGFGDAELDGDAASAPPPPSSSSSSSSSLRGGEANASQTTDEANVNKSETLSKVHKIVHDLNISGALGPKSDVANASEPVGNSSEPNTTDAAQSQQGGANKSEPVGNSNSTQSQQGGNTSEPVGNSSEPKATDATQTQQGGNASEPIGNSPEPLVADAPQSQQGGNASEPRGNSSEPNVADAPPSQQGENASEPAEGAVGNASGGIFDVLWKMVEAIGGPSGTVEADAASNSSSNESATVSNIIRTVGELNESAAFGEGSSTDEVGSNSTPNQTADEVGSNGTLNQTEPSSKSISKVEAGLDAAEGSGFQAAVPKNVGAPLCATRDEERAKSHVFTTSPPGTPCVFGADARDEGSHCIFDDGDYGSFGWCWCFTAADRSSFGSCNESCPLFGYAKVLSDKIDLMAEKLELQKEQNTSRS